MDTYLATDDIRNVFGQDKNNNKKKQCKFKDITLADYLPINNVKFA